MLKKRLSCQRGFTLIEMVIVVVVIGILMGLAFQGISTVQQNARDTRRLADLRRVQTQLELFFSRCGHYPVNSTAACVTGTLPAAAGNVPWSGLRTALSLVVRLEEVPSDPLPAKSYEYRFGPQGLEYALGAATERIGPNRDISGAIHGLDCNAFYCMRS